MDQVAAEVLGVSGAVFCHISSLAAGLENIQTAIEVDRASRIWNITTMSCICSCANLTASVNNVFITRLKLTLPTKISIWTA